MSTPEYPKQFIDVLGSGRTLIQMTVDRLSPLCPPEHMWVVTSAAYVDIVRSQLPQIPSSNILSEPEARNTAPCIAYACWKIRSRYPDANVIVTPSDALVIDVVEYRRVLQMALDFTAGSDSIVTVGIKPSRPETGYGYIEMSFDDFSEIHKVLSFKEKPDFKTAEKYLSEGGYLWNAGIFVWNIDTITSAIRRFAPQIASVMDRMSLSFYTPAENATVRELFPTCDKISIDYAVMEKSDEIYTIPAEFGWSDLGSWGSLKLNVQNRDGSGNAIVSEGDSGQCEVRLFDCDGCVVHTPGLHKVILDGLKDYIVAEKDGALLVCRLSDEQRIKEFNS